MLVWKSRWGESIIWGRASYPCGSFAYVLLGVSSKLANVHTKIHNYFIFTLTVSASGKT